MNLEAYIERIEQYETGHMTATERDAFERELSENKELQQALKFYREADAAIEEQIAHTLRHQISVWSSAGPKYAAPRYTPVTRKLPASSIRARWAVAAAITLLFAWVMINWGSYRVADQTLYTDYYKQPVEPTFRASVDNENVLQIGMEAIALGQYERAVAFFNSYAPDSPYFVEAQYYLGHSALLNRQYDQAMNAFREVTRHSDPKFQEKAEWNLLLTYVKAERSQEAACQDLLNRVASMPEHSYHKQARELKESLSSFWRKFN